MLLSDSERAIVLEMEQKILKLIAMMYLRELEKAIAPPLPDKIESYMSMGVNALGLKRVSEYFGSMPTDLPIISVGSGSGALEKHLDSVHHTDIICVDPLEHVFLETPAKYCKKPVYPRVSDLIKDQPHLVGNCSLLLNWSSPVFSVYDYDALVALKPRYLLWIGDTTGNAAGYKMLSWINKCGIKSFIGYHGNTIPPYQVLKESHLDGFADGDPNMPARPTIALMTPK